jgi:BCD family chlorophyll transporter-like MFS transporter
MTQVLTGNAATELPAEKNKEHLTLGHNLKIGLFHLGSGMADVLTTGVWNRIMVTDLGFAATPVALLVALRYFLAPLGILAGRVSDERRILGFHRMFWIGLGRALMVASTFILGFATADIARAGVRGYADGWHWLMIAVALIMFSFGTAISGTTFLALIYDRSPEHQRGRAVGVVWTFLLLGYTAAGILFSVLLPGLPEGSQAQALPYTVESLQTLFIVAGLIFAAVWLASMWGEEKRGAALPRRSQAQAGEQRRSLKEDLALVWRSSATRYFLYYLSLSMFFAFSQDLILEPFAGDVFEMPARVTNRFSAYWGTMAILGTIFFIWYSRRNKRLTNTLMSQIGMAVLAATFALLALSSIANIRQLVTPALITLGIGLGIWNVGTLGLMMDLSPLGRAGTFLGFWTLVVTFSRGFGTSFGGIGRDSLLALTDSLPLAYGLTFGIGVVGLLVGMYCLAHVNVEAFKSQEESASTETIFAGAMD